MKKTIITIKGVAGQGKSETIKLLRNFIKSTHSPIETIIIDREDIKVILEINGIKVGIESQGDPKSRLPTSIDEFVAINCDVIICASRTSGETENAILDTVSKGYRVIWAANYRSNQASHTDLNNLSAKHLLDLFNQVITGAF